MEKNKLPPGDDNAALAKRPRADHTPVEANFLDACMLDILQELVSFVPERPRLLVLSLVSRRWRTAVLRSIRHVQLHSPDSPRALGLFPCLSALTVSPSFARLSAPLPSCIASLHLIPPVVITDLYEPAHFATLPHLTSLTLLLSNATPKLLAFLAAHAASLTSLDVSVEDDVAYHALAFASLRHLRLTLLNGAPTARAASLVTALASQLLSLHVSLRDAGVADFVQDVLSATYPVLRSLSVPGLSPRQEELLEQRVPSLARLALTANNAALSAPLMARLVECDARTLSPGSYPQLEHVRLVLHRVSYDTVLRGVHAPSLHTLSVQVERVSLAGAFMELLARVYGEFASVREVRLVAATSPKGQLGRWRVPELPTRQVLALVRQAEAAGVATLRLACQDATVRHLAPSLLWLRLTRWVRFTGLAL